MFDKIRVVTSDHKFMVGLIDSIPFRFDDGLNPTFNIEKSNSLTLKQAIDRVEYNGNRWTIRCHTSFLEWYHENINNLEPGKIERV